MTEKQQGILLVALGAICFSAKAIFIKMAYAAYEVDFLTLLTLRFAFALPFFVAIAFWRISKNKFVHLKPTEWLSLAALAFLGYYLASLFDFMGLQYITAGLERIILFIYPSLVVLISWVFLGQKISRIGFIALLITYLGIAIISFDPHILETQDLKKGGAMILVSAVTYAIYLVFGGEKIKKLGSINFNTIALMFSSIYVITHFSVMSEVSFWHLPAGLYGYGLVLALVSTVIPTFMVMQGIKLLGANLASIVSSIGPVSTIVLAYIFLGETLSYQEIAGSTLIIVGIVLTGK